MRGGLAAAVTIALCLLASPAAAQSQGVTIADNVFIPAIVTVAPGTTITWRHAGSGLHSVTSQPGSTESFDSSPQCPPSCILPGTTFVRRFETPGRYPYFCHRHGRPDVAPDPSRADAQQPCNMCGLVIVQSSQETPTPRPATPRSTPVRVTIAPPITPAVAAGAATASTSPSPSPEQAQADGPASPQSQAVVSSPSRSQGGRRSAAAAGIAALALGSAGTVAGVAYRRGLIGAGARRGRAGGR